MFPRIPIYTTNLQNILHGLQRFFKKKINVANFSNSICSHEKLKRLWDSGQYKNAVNYFNEIDVKTSHDWQLLINGFGKLNNLDMMFNFYDEMKNSWMFSPGSNPKPGLHIIGSMLHVYAKHSEYESINALIEEISLLALTPNIEICTILLMAHKKNPKADLFNKAQEMGIKFDKLVVRSVQMREAQKKGNITDMLSFFNTLRKNSSVSVGDYTTVIKTMGGKNVGQAVKYFKLMVTDGVRPTTATINTMLSLFSKEKNTAAMMKIFLTTISISDPGYEIVQSLFENKRHNIYARAIQGKKLKPDAYTFTIFIQAFMTEPPKAIFFWNLMMKHQLRPSQISYHAMFNVYARENPPNVDKLLDCWEEMKDSGYTPNSESVEIVANAFLKLGETNQALEIIMQFAQKNGHDKIPEHTYFMFLNIFAKNGNIEQVNALMQLMRLAKLDPDYNPIAQNIMITAHYHSNGVDAAIRQFISIKKRSIRPHYQMYCNILKILFRDGKISHGCQLLRAIPPEIGYSDGSHHWGSNLLNSCLRTCMKQPPIDKLVQTVENSIVGTRPMSNSSTKHRRDGFPQVMELMNCILTTKIQLKVPTAIEYLNFVRPHCSHLRKSDELLFRIDRMIKILTRSTHNFPHFPNDLVLNNFSIISKDVQQLVQSA